MPIEKPAVLKLIGGAIHKKVGSVIAEKFPITKMLEGGALGGAGGLMQRVLQGGLGQVLQSPIAGIAGQLQGQIGAAVGALSSVAGAAGLVSALTGSGGLGEAVSGLSRAADLLSGVAMPGAGEFGAIDALSHGTVTDFLGSATPVSLGLDAVLGPLNATLPLSVVSTALPNVIAGVVGGTIPVSAATTWVLQMAAGVDGIRSASWGALDFGQQMAEPLSTVSAIAAAIEDPDPRIRAVVAMIAKPDAYADMKAGLAAHLEV